MHQGVVIGFDILYLGIHCHMLSLQLPNDILCKLVACSCTRMWLTYHASCQPSDPLKGLQKCMQATVAKNASDIHYTFGYCQVCL